MPPPTDWTDKDPIIRSMRMATPQKTWDEISKAVGVAREAVRFRAKTVLKDCYEEKHPQRNR